MIAKVFMKSKYSIFIHTKIYALCVKYLLFHYNEHLSVQNVISYNNIL